MRPGCDEQDAQANDGRIATCPRCGAPSTRSALPAALCPVCLLALAAPELETPSGDNDESANTRYRVLTVLEGDDDRTTYLAERCWPSRVLVTMEVVRAGAVPEELEGRLTALKRITHPGTARILETLIGASGDCCVVAEYVPGLPLDDYCARNHLPRLDRLRFLSDVCVAVAAAHEVGVVHGRLCAKVVVVNNERERPAATVTGFSVCSETVSREDDVTALVRMIAGVDLDASLAAFATARGGAFKSVSALREAIEAECERGSTPATN